MAQPVPDVLGCQRLVPNGKQVLFIAVSRLQVQAAAKNAQHWMQINVQALRQPRCTSETLVAPVHLIPMDSYDHSLRHFVACRWAASLQFCADH